MVVKRDLVVQTVPYTTKIASGQKRVSDFAKLAFNGLPEIRQNLDLSAHFYSSTKNNRGNVLRIPFPINN